MSKNKTGRKGLAEGKRKREKKKSTIREKIEKEKEMKKKFVVSQEKFTMIVRAESKKVHNLDAQ